MVTVPVQPGSGLPCTGPDTSDAVRGSTSASVSLTSAMADTATSSDAVNTSFSACGESRAARRLLGAKVHLRPARDHRDEQAARPKTAGPAAVLAHPWLPVFVTTTIVSNATSGPIDADCVNGAAVSSGTRPPGSRSIEYTVPNPVTSKTTLRRRRRDADTCRHDSVRSRNGDLNIFAAASPGRLRPAVRTACPATEPEARRRLFRRQRPRPCGRSDWPTTPRCRRWSSPT
jgi:hypothetical protein